MDRLGWLFWVLVAVTVGVPGVVLLRLDPVSIWTIPVYYWSIAERIVAAILLSVPAVIGILAGVKSFWRESRLRPCSASTRWASASASVREGAQFGAFAGFVVGIIIGAWPVPSLLVPFYAGVGVCYGLITSSITALLFGTGVGQRAAGEASLPADHVQDPISED